MTAPPPQAPGPRAAPTPAPWAPEPELVDDCIHCGFCLPGCPTYVLWAEEMDSPRGRIHLMRQGVEGAALSASTVAHFDACLGCMACLTACPAGVNYEQLIEQTRAGVESQHRRPRRERLTRAAIFALFPYPRRLRRLLPLLRAYRALRVDRLLESTGLVNLLPKSLRAASRLAPDLTRAKGVPAAAPQPSSGRAQVALLTGCVQSVFFPNVNAATERVLAAEGYDVVVPPGQGCCGALSSHSGRDGEARRFARAVIDAFERAGAARVVVNAAGCGSAMKHYGELLFGDPDYAERAARFGASVCDVAELLAEAPRRAPRHRLELSAAYHDACHLRHAQQVHEAPRQLLGEIPGLELLELPEADLCCGSAGVYNLLQPEPAAALGDRKARNVAAVGPQLLVAANPGCTMQISAALARIGVSLPTAHTIEVLDASIRGAPADELLSADRRRAAPALRTPGAAAPNP